MTFLFAWPLILCVLPCAVLAAVPRIPGPSLLSALTWNTGAALVTVSSLLRGIFEIAGNSSVYQAAMMTAGFIMLFAGLVLYVGGVLLRLKS